jgi:hypothetical protein
MRIAVLAGMVLLGACMDEQPRTARHPPGEGQIVETTDLPPVIVLGDLATLGFDTTRLYEIEPHFATLNTALVTLAELKRSYDATTDEQQRRRLNAYAVPLHLTADTHHRVILQLVGAPLDSVFDRYVDRRKRAAGLADWHADHREAPSATELPGLVPPISTRH